ncbi:hypothetical protein B0H11DRAFT_2202098 [Mycena galericulata]|nr:hypothetical protein B0H11DRAFT_2202098 [Mycena galericulata]
MREFPQELIDKVLDQLPTDGTDIGIYGLVCKGWLPRSRYHLFSTVDLTAENISAFVDLVDASSLPLLTYIRHLKLTYDGQPPDAVYLECLQCCPNLTRIGIYIVGKGSVDSSALSWLDSDEFLHAYIRSWSANTVTLSQFELKARNTASVPLRSIIKLISCIPFVEALSIQVVSGISGSSGVANLYPSDIPFPSRLARLDVFFRGAQCFFDWLLSLPAAPLKSFQCFGGFVEFDQTNLSLAASSFVQRSGGKLDSLTLNMLPNPEESQSTIWVRTFLESTIHLRHLSFICENTTDILDILPLLPVSTLNSLTINLFEYEHYEEIWNQIDDALAGAQFRNLRQLCIGPRRDYSLSSSTRLPLATARGIVEEPQDATRLPDAVKTQPVADTSTSRVLHETHFFLLAALLALFSSAHGTIYQIPPSIQNESSTAQFTSSAFGIDAPKVSPINASSFDWWYFDVVSKEPTSALASVVVTFFTSSAAAFPLLSSVSPKSDSTLSAYIWVTFPNGTLWSGIANGEENATVTSDSDYTTGVWHGTGFSWVGSKAGSHRRTTPAAPPSPAKTWKLARKWGGANAVPDAASVVDLSTNGVKLVFEGVGYHDKNWSPRPFITSLAPWYWGHGHIGPYSLVWFDLLDTSGTEHVSAFLSENGRIIFASCAPGSISVRPTGPGRVNATYPPVLSTPDPEGYRIVLSLPRVDGGHEATLDIDVSVTFHIVRANPEYARLIGNLSTSSGLTGVALFEQFKVTV